jgi:hypothetical protein
LTGSDKFIKKSNPLPTPDYSLANQESEDLENLSKAELIDHLKRTAKALSAAEQHAIVQTETEEVYAAQAVVQDLTLVKMNKTVYAYEQRKKKKKGLSLPMEGYGRFWTNMDIIQMKRKQQDAAAQEIADKLKREEVRNQNKELQENIERDWKRMKLTHEKAVKLWEVQCAEMKVEGVRRKDLPKKPSRPRKPQMPQRDG